MKPALSIISPTNDRKTRTRKNQYNTFGTLPGIEGTCPGATCADGGCSYIAEDRKLPVCYVNKLMSAFPGVRNILEYNTAELKTENTLKLFTTFTREFQRFYDYEKKHDNITEDGTSKAWYRIHWAGDIPNMAYARALAAAMRQFDKRINFWCYTRTFEAVSELALIPNCIT